MKRLVEKIVLWMDNYLKQSSCNGFVLGISGGIDSAVLAVILKKYFTNYYMTYWIDINSSSIDYEFAKLLIKNKKIKCEEIDLKNSFKDLENNLNLNSNNSNNVKSRLRMIALYAKAQELNFLVVGTTNLIEYKIGYFTKYGDGSSDISPLRDLIKKEIRELALYLEVPIEIINRKPTAGLFEGQTDEEDIGIKYNDMDNYFSNKNIDEKIKNKIETKVKDNEHKRKISPSPFAKGK